MEGRWKIDGIRSSPLKGSGPGRALHKIVGTTRVMNDRRTPKCSSTPPASTNQGWHAPSGAQCASRAVSANPRTNSQLLRLAPHRGAPAFHRLPRGKVGGNSPVDRQVDRISCMKKMQGYMERQQVFMHHLVRI